MLAKLSFPGMIFLMLMEAIVGEATQAIPAGWANHTG